MALARWADELISRESNLMNQVPYSPAELTSIYELGRLYFEMGYFIPAERIFGGLSAVDGGQTPSRLGLGLVKLERGFPQEAVLHLRAALQNLPTRLQTELALALAFVAEGEFLRARQMLEQIAKDHARNTSFSGELRTLWKALSLRCQ